MSSLALGATGFPAGERRFVVQLHRARRLHYDFRLEIDGVLASWAVPKGPSMDASVRRLAVHVEDHSLDYFDFEGVIPAGNYGAGDVTVWDWGTWRPGLGEDPAEAVRRGRVHADLFGTKLMGSFILLRTTRLSGNITEKNQWLLFRKRDAQAIDKFDAAALPRSVKSGRTNDEVRAEAASDVPMSTAP